ncbi:MAG: CRTAC1 family protein [Acidobacteriota bacterium]
MKRTISIAALMLSMLACSQQPPPPPGASTENKTDTKIRFADSTQQSGVQFRHVPTRTNEKWMPETIGSGVVTADFNRDGAPDIVLVNSGVVWSAERGPDAGNKLFINDGHGKFTDKTAEWKLPSTGYGMGAAAGDFNNDGWLDLFLTSFDGNNRLLKNTGTGFEDVTDVSGVKSDGKWATSAGFADFDSDGDLDLFVVRYVDYDRTATASYRNRIPVYATPVAFDATPDQLWRNDGNGKFTDFTAQSGLTDNNGKGLALALGDIDADGDVDAYVANDTSPNSLWINDGKGNFRDVAPLAGAAYSEVGKEEGSMGADFSDTDSNGFMDIVVTNFQEENASIYSQTQRLLFAEISDAVGVGQSSRARLKFGVDFFDADNDGDEDLLIANGHIEDNIDQNSSSVTFAQQNLLLENLGTGKFADISNSSGPALADKQVSRGLATGDLDGDGDLDFVITNNGGTAQIAFNETIDKGSFVVLWLEGLHNKCAIGARLVAKIGERTIERQVMGSQSYLSMSDLRVHFGLATAQQIDELTIYWPGGDKQVIASVAAGKFYSIREGDAPVEFVPGAFTYVQSSSKPGGLHFRTSQ